MEASKRRPTYQVIDGDKVSIQILPEIYRQALKFVPEEGDIVQTTFPRCGSHWVQQIIQLILNKGESAKTFAELARRAPFIEFSGELSKSSPRLIRTHLPLGKIQLNDKAKYVYVARNPWDCCLSMFHFLRELPGLNFEDGLFDDCVDSFIEGTTGGGDWFQHLLSGYKLKDQPNVFFVHKSADPALNPNLTMDREEKYAPPLTLLTQRLDFRSDLATTHVKPEAALAARSASS
ncbi:hypothetical protein HPB47_024960 [Ixodes persulcatus]|uniref:Uncharacterized protein n=1 Tax=Ixodes persulcatus TaxID=34615 RepID=A0AC60Q2T9_IXOPE|nr:hypothetical protein HPB47_024960 [Ixodes persulcatus]